MANLLRFPWLGETYGARICYAAAGTITDGGGDPGGAGGGGADTVAGGGGNDTVAGAQGGGGSGTIAGTVAGAQGGNQPPPPATWPEDWRARIAGKDDALLTRITKFQSPETFAKALLAREKQFDSGTYVRKLPEGANENEVAAWRKENGIPEKPDGYLEALPDGLVVSDGDKELLSAFLGEAHGINAPPAMVGKFVDWYYKTEERLTDERAQKDAEIRDTGIETLRSEWGGEYKGNLNAIANFIPADIYGPLMGARMPDGTPVGSHVGMLKWLVAAALDANPAARITPAESRLGGGGGVENRIAEIERVMREDRPAYNKNEKMQAELRDLYEARERIKTRAA